MTIKTINTESEYEKTLELIEGLMDAEPGTPEEDLLDELSRQVEAYEALNYPIELPTLEEAIKFRKEQEQATP